MATKTTNYNLTKPAYDEDADIAVINKNMDIIDAKMKEIEEAGGGAQITVDSQLSETSTNPVQNKVINSKIAELNSNLNSEISRSKEADDELKGDLDTLEYSDVAGGKNLFDGKFINELIDIGGNYTQRNLKEEFVSIRNVKGLTYITFGGYFKKGTYTFSYTNDAWFSLNRIAIAGTYCIGITQTIRKSYTWTQNIDGWTYFGIEGDDGETGTVDTPFSITPDIMIEKGSTATEYEPYIPSVKMLADEVSAQNESLDQLKNDLGGLSFSVSGTTLSITDGTNTWTLEAN